MRTINISNKEIGVCNNNKCVNIKGNIAKSLAFGLAVAFVVSEVHSFIQTKKKVKKYEYI